MSFSTRDRRDGAQVHVTLGDAIVDSRVLTKAQVRFMLQSFHPDRYRGDNPVGAAKMFAFFLNYEGV